MDVGPAMSRCWPGEETAFQQAKKVLTLFVQRQVFAESKDEVAVVLFGTDGTENALATRDQYRHITVQRHLLLPDFQLLEEIQDAVQPGAQQADFLDALIVCMDILQKETLGKKFAKLHIAVLSDLSGPCSADQLEVIVANLKKAGISLQFFLPFPADDEGDGAGGDGQSRGPGKGLSEQQQDGVRMVRQILLSLEGEDGLAEVYTFRDSLEKLSMFKKLERQPMPWTCHLTIGSQISIRIVGYKAVTEEKVKKSWSVVDAKSLKRDDVQKETVFCLNNDEETEVQKDDTIQGFRYGSDVIPFSKVDQEQMKYKTESQSFAVLGFTKASLVERTHFMGNQVLKVFAPKDDEPAAIAFSALVRALHDTGMVAIVRYAYSKRSNPQVGVAFPHSKETCECLVYVQLPFMEDLRSYVFSSLSSNKKVKPTDAQLSAVDSLIDNMSLVHEDDEIIEDLFKPNKIPNPQFQRLFQCLQHKAFHPEEPLPAAERHLLDLLQTPAEVKRRCAAALAKVKSSFPLQESSQMKEQITAQHVFPDSNQEPEAKRAKTKEEDFSISQLADGSTTSVGSVSPADDFRFLVRQKNANFQDLSQQLEARIFECLDIKQQHYYRKSLGCIACLRAEALRLSHVRVFNDFLRSLKERTASGGLKEFWEILVQDGISLITSEESAQSAVTADEAKQFLAPSEAEEDAALADEGGDIDDLLDMI